ncbi:MAG: hypothetical protein ACRDR6_31055 [Pseudonocardiaceae bacterium]
MALFRRKGRSLPLGYGRGLAAWGEHLVGQNPRFDPSDLADLDVMDFASEDPDGFVDAMALEIAGHGSAAALGACETIHHTLQLNVNSPAWWQLVDQANDYLRESGILWRSLKAYQQQRWKEAHGSASW